MISDFTPATRLILRFSMWLHGTGASSSLVVCPSGCFIFIFAPSPPPCCSHSYEQVKEIFHFLSQKGYEETRSALDLAFTSDAVADEKVPFLAYLARSLRSGTMRSANEPAAGSLQFRAQVASFLRLYFRAPLSLQVGMITRVSVCRTIQVCTHELQA